VAALTPSESDLSVVPFFFLFFLSFFESGSAMHSLDQLWFHCSFLTARDIISMSWCSFSFR